MGVQPRQGGRRSEGGGQPGPAAYGGQQPPGAHRAVRCEHPVANQHGRTRDPHGREQTRA